MEYILDNLPLKVIKYVLKIYDSSNDPDKKITSIDELFNPIKTIIMNNPVVPMNESSNLIKNLDEYIYPYFKDNIELFVVESTCQQTYWFNLFKCRKVHKNNKRQSLSKMFVCFCFLSRFPSSPLFFHFNNVFLSFNLTCKLARFF